MALPWGCTVTFLEHRFNAFAATMAFTHTSQSGFPDHGFGRPKSDLRFYADMHDTENLPFATLDAFLRACLHPTHETTSEAKVEYWQDEKQQDALITFSFAAWAAEVSFGTMVPKEAVTFGKQPENLNHVFHLRLAPVPTEDHYLAINTGN